MKLSEYIKEMTELLEHEGDMECIYRKDDEGNAHYRVDGSGYTKYVTELQYDNEVYDHEEFGWLLDQEYIESVDELIKVCIING